MLRKHLFQLAALSAALAFPQFAAAQESKPKEKTPEDVFKELDKNGDGKLTAAEIADDRKRFFEHLVRVGDKDKNGELTKTEFVEGFKPDELKVAAPQDGGRPGAGRPGNFDPAQLFNRLDRNGDGKITKDEIPDQGGDRFKAMFEPLGKNEITREEFARSMQRAGGQPQLGGADFFKRLDRNNDGKLTLDEVPEGMKQRITEFLERSGKGKDGSVNAEEFARFAGQGRPGQPSGRPGEPMPQGGIGMMGGPLIFRKLDRNNDGKLSKEELAKAAEIFDELDSNKDGTIDPRELFGAPPGGIGPRPPGAGAPGGPGGAGGAGGAPGAAAKPAEIKPADATASSADKPKDAPPVATRKKAREGRAGGLRRLDKDGDGKVSKSEADGKLKDNFDKVDKNGDGLLDQTELRGALEQLGRKKADKKTDA